MSDEQAFIRGLCANAEDETLRLVYADWLEERGDPRGEFLRVESALNAVRRGNRDDPRLRARLAELRPAVTGGFCHAEAWLALVDRSGRDPVGRKKGWLESVFDRLVEAVTPSEWGEVFRHESQGPPLGTQEYGADGTLCEYDDRCGWCQVPPGWQTLREKGNAE
jgi:uncharacterized protein (TIGR02996 family)